MPAMISAEDFAKLSPALVTFDDPAPHVAALIDPADKWNGWTCPLVTRAGLLELLAVPPYNGPDGWARLIEETADTVTVEADERDEPYTFDKVTTPDGREWIDLRGAGWCFSTVDCTACDGHGTNDNGTECRDCRGTGRAPLQLVQRAEDEERATDRLTANVSPAQLAHAFTDALRAHLGPEKFSAMRLRNYKAGPSPVCASHDYCDANEVMHAAGVRIGAWHRAEGMTDRVTALWNAAWTAARTPGMIG